MKLIKIYFLTTSLLYALNYFSSYYFHKTYYPRVYEGNPLLRNIFNTGLTLTILFYLIIITIFAVTGILFKIIARSLKTRLEININVEKIIISAYYLTIIILEIITILHDFYLVFTSST